ncbi:hypothetical protein DC347_13465, partial [Pseudarthrobacter sp. AG30]|uniref:hypothetical protein n=1 Tax=Pseudarthrobacter sp. AG30 TaxID=2249742 RepID=UPI000DCEAD97
PQPTHWPGLSEALWGNPLEMESGQQDLYVPAHFGLPVGRTSQREQPLIDAPHLLEGADRWDMPAIDLPFDPGPSENELPTDPFPEWQLFLDFEDVEAPVPSG